LLLLQTTPSIFSMLGSLGPAALSVLAVLAVFSIFSWAVLVDRLLLFRKAEKQGTRFLEAFHDSSKFSQVKAACEQLSTTPLSGVFMAGYAEISSQLEAGDRQDGGIDMEALERSLRRAAHQQRRLLERGMLFLATTGTVTPFIGLFGTVWGIMEAFRSIGAFGNASLAIVAPGISEALIATAAGLAVAIPAVISYNHLLSRVRRLGGDMEDFGLEFLNLVKKTWHGGRS